MEIKPFKSVIKLFYFISTAEKKFITMSNDFNKINSFTVNSLYLHDISIVNCSALYDIFSIFEQCIYSYTNRKSDD